MKVKELKIRILRGLIRPEYFYIPLHEHEEPVSNVLIIEAIDEDGDPCSIKEIDIYVQSYSYYWTYPWAASNPYTDSSTQHFVFEQDYHWEIPMTQEQLSALTVPKPDLQIAGVTADDMNVSRSSVYNTSAYFYFDEPYPSRVVIRGLPAGHYSYSVYINESYDSVKYNDGHYDGMYQDKPWYPINYTSTYNGFQITRAGKVTGESYWQYSAYDEEHSWWYTPSYDFFLISRPMQGNRLLLTYKVYPRMKFVFKWITVPELSGTTFSIDSAGNYDYEVGYPLSYGDNYRFNRGWRYPYRGFTNWTITRTIDKMLGCDIYKYNKSTLTWDYKGSSVLLPIIVQKEESVKAVYLDTIPDYYLDIIRHTVTSTYILTPDLSSRFDDGDGPSRWQIHYNSTTYDCTYEDSYAEPVDYYVDTDIGVEIPEKQWLSGYNDTETIELVTSSSQPSAPTYLRDFSPYSYPKELYYWNMPDTEYNTEVSEGTAFVRANKESSDISPNYEQFAYWRSHDYSTSETHLTGITKSGTDIILSATCDMSCRAQGKIVNRSLTPFAEQYSSISDLRDEEHLNEYAGDPVDIYKTYHYTTTNQRIDVNNLLYNASYYDNYDDVMERLTPETWTSNVYCTYRVGMTGEELREYARYFSQSTTEVYFDDT